jgi:hypothetical protein
MSRIRLSLLSLVAVFAISAIASASASAIEFEFAGSGVLENAVGVGAAGFELKAAGLPTINCTVVELETGAIVNGTAKNSANAIEFKNCTDTSDPTECAVPNIKTKPVKSTLEGVAPAATDKFEPASGTEFVAVKINSISPFTCLAAGLDKVTGTATASAPNSENAEPEHTITFDVDNTELKFAAKNAEFDGEATLELADETDRVWSAD